MFNNIRLGSHYRWLLYKRFQTHSTRYFLSPNISRDTLGKRILSSCHLTLRKNSYELNQLFIVLRTQILDSNIQTSHFSNYGGFNLTVQDITIIGCGHISFITSYVIPFPCPLPTIQSLWWIKKLTSFLPCLLTGSSTKSEYPTKHGFITYNNKHYRYPTIWISNDAMLSNDLKFVYKTLKV